MINYFETDKMDFCSAVQTINNLLRQQQPQSFSSSWIRQFAPQVYRFIQKNIRNEIGGINWDRFTRALDLKFQRQWYTSWSKGVKLYRDKTEVEIILRRYDDKLYNFVTQNNENDKNTCDIISIALVRIAQKGNMLAKRKIINLVSFTIDQWIEHYPQISRWEGYHTLIRENIEGCIRRYRYSGSFMGYLFRTREYAGRGLKPLIACSLEDSLYSGKQRRIDRIGQDTETGEILIYF